MKKFVALLFLATIVSAFAAGCQNKYEKSGVSPIPQNRPSSWEDSNTRGANN